MNPEKIERRFHRRRARKHRAQRVVEALLVDAPEARRKRRGVAKLCKAARRRVKEATHFRARVVSVEPHDVTQFERSAVVTLKAAGERVVVDASMSRRYASDQASCFKWDRFDIRFEDDSTIERCLNAAS